MRLSVAMLLVCPIMAGAVAGDLHARNKGSGKYGDLTNREMYDLAQGKIEHGGYYKARTILERLIKRPSLAESLLPEIQLSMADAYYGKSGLLNLAEAMSRYANFLTFYPTHERADYAQYRLALCHFQQVYAPDRDQAETRVAIEEFRKIEGLYPDSPYVDLATERIQDGSDLLAEHEFRVGLFYYQRHAYLGAIDRFLTVLDRYPRYQNRDKLYYHLGTALILTARAEEGEIYLNKLLETYPGSRYEGKATVLLKEQQAGGMARLQGEGE